MSDELTDAQIEKTIIARGLTAPRVTSARIAELVDYSAKAYHHFPGTTVTVCCLTLPNGFSVIGRSAAASAENFDHELGRDIALQDARDQVWQLEGYALRERLTGNGG